MSDLYLYVFLNQELNQLIIWLKASIFKEAPPIKAPSTELMLQICLELIEDTTDSITLSCHSKHYFHKNCIYKWVIRKNKDNCPICRRTISEGDIQLINESVSPTDNYSDGRRTRNENPDVTDFYILHEGFIGVFDEDLQEEGYDDIKEKKKEYSAGEGWLGITDKYWLTALVPEKKSTI